MLIPVVCAYSYKQTEKGSKTPQYQATCLVGSCFTSCCGNWKTFILYLVRERSNGETQEVTTLSILCTLSLVQVSIWHLEILLARQESYLNASKYGAQSACDVRRMVAEVSKQRFDFSESINIPTHAEWIFCF